MRKSSGDQLRQSSAQSNQLIAENLPNLFPTEEWHAFYWNMERDGRLDQGRAILRLPRGVGAVTREVRNGKPGVIEHVRRWGVTLRGGILEDIGFDPTPLLSRDRTRYASDDAEALHLITLMTHYDLPGFFVIASEEHPFLLFDPEGSLKGSYTRWYTHAGALAYIVSDGKVQTSFGLTWEEDRGLYRKVMTILNEEMEKKNRQSPHAE
jgi:hypothetical protein